MEVPFVDLPLQNQKLQQQILPLWQEIFATAQFISGKYVAEFEKCFAAACQAEHCVAVGSGTDALRFALLALEIQPGDEVITVPNTYIATTEAISQTGGKIVFVDIDRNTYNIDPRMIEKAITSKTRGIIPVHLYGNPADMNPILEIARRYDLWVLEDACQAHLAEYKGKKVGTLGDIAAFSFYPGKNLGACGDAGAIVTNDSQLADKIKLLRDHGQRQKYHHEIEGYTGRCDNLQAAALWAKLPYLETWNQQRRKNAAIYMEQLGDLVPTQHIAPENTSVYHLFVIEVENRDQVREFLQSKGISTGMHYPIPLHQQKAYHYLQIGSGSFPNTEQYAPKTLSLPMFPELTEQQIMYVCDHLRSSLEVFPQFKRRNFGL